MNALIKNNPVLVGGVLIAGVVVAWLTLRGAKGMGQDIGGGAVNLVVGAVQGAGGAILDAGAGAADTVEQTLLDPEKNPFYDVGAGLGSWFFDVTHGE